MLAAFPSSIFNLTILQLTINDCTIRETKITESSETKPLIFSCPHQNLNLTATWQTYNIVAASCTMFPCVKNYHAQVQGGILEERVVNEVPALEDHWDYNYRYPDRVHFNEPCIIDRQHYTLNDISKVPARNSTVFNVTSSNGKNVTVPGECYFQFNSTFAWALLRSLTSTFNGICYIPDHLQRASNHARLRAEVQCNNSILYSNIDDYWWLQSLYDKGNARRKATPAAFS
jgi:hypothetical protein